MDLILVNKSALNLHWIIKFQNTPNPKICDSLGEKNMPQSAKTHIVGLYLSRYVYTKLKCI